MHEYVEQKFGDGDELKGTLYLNATSPLVRRLAEKPPAEGDAGRGADADPPDGPAVRGADAVGGGRGGGVSGIVGVAGKTAAVMSKWDWMYDYEKDARAKGDVVRLRMVRVGQEAWGYRETDPAKAQALYEEGLRMAKQLGEPWWVMYYAQRRIQARMFWCDHFDDALGWAVESALEARKPQYASFPLLFSVYFKLVFGYASVDAAGYAAEIRQALSSLEHDVPRFNLEDHFLLEFAKRQFALGLDDMEGVEQSAARSLRLAEDGAAGRSADYHLAFVYEDLCGANFRRGDWEALAENAALGEARSRRAGEQLPLSECQLWQALLALRAGEEVRRGPCAGRRSLA